jgi:long-subunit fatty acid transport protein
MSAGLTFSFEEGNVEERWDIEFDEQPPFVPAAGFQKADLSGTGYGGGLVLRPIGNLMVGGSYESEIEYDADVSRQFTEASLDTSFTSTLTLPARASVGITWGFGSWLFLGSYAWSDFADFQGLAFPSHRLSQETSYAFGVEYAGFSVGAKRLPIRLSFNFQELPFDHPTGQKIERYLVGLGTGVEMMGGKGKFDFAIQGGKTGAIGENGIEDRLVRFYIGLAGGEAWTRRAGRQP